MTNLQKIQQETEEIFFNKYPVGMETIDFLHSRESIAYKAGLDEVREKVKEKMKPLDKRNGTYYEYKKHNDIIDSVLTLIDEEINK